MQEETFRLPSDNARITVGEARSNTFVLSGNTVPESHEMFTRESDGYRLNLTSEMTGRITIQAEESDISDRKGQSVSIVPGDWGVVHFESVTFFFQFVEPGLLPAKRFFGAFQGTLATSIWFSLVVQLVFIFVARILWDEQLANERYELDPRWIQIIAAAPPDEIMDVEEEEAIDETTSQRAGGEEGEFGEEDSEIDESILPDHDGPLVEELDTTELGRALEAAIAESGSLSRIFDANDLMTGIGADFATAGEGDAYVVGRGSGGLGVRGTGRGGGGSGFGRVHGVGEIDTGGGRGVSANLGRRSQRAPRARVERGRASINGFLSREQIERVVRRHTRGIRYCYERELQDDVTLEGRITVNWTIGLDGHVSRRTIESNSMGNRDVESCLLREVGRMRFPEPDGGIVIVSYPFNFRGQAE
jgi:hypothetical protein